MDERTEDRSTAVPRDERAKQVEEIHARWAWVEPADWTTRMLTALEEGVKGGVWFALIDKVFAERNLRAAFQQVAKNDGATGVDGETVRAFERRLAEMIRRLSEALKAGTFSPQAIRRGHIPKPGTTETRPLGIPTVRDRVVQAAVVNVIEPIFERGFAEHSYGFRPGRGCKDALRRLSKLLEQGYVHVVDADLKGYFDSIPHGQLMARVKERIADGRVLRLIGDFLKADILDDMKRWTPEQGAPQGAVLSPLLSNIYLDPLDHLLARHGIEMVRYADDFVILCQTAEDAAKALELVKQWVSDNGLTLHPDKTQIVDSRTESFDFLGYTFQGREHWPRKKAVQKMRDTIRAKTVRQNGRSIQCVIADVNKTVRGWFAYFKHGTKPRLYRDQDGWIRMRLRSILRCRDHRLGRGRGRDHQLWPNAYFAKRGLYSLVAARAAAVQSLRR
ncbi:MAG: group II intron reverse transcriptase/maturase [Planctomycetia bacterium]|nr:group II intron reverse transcriptase/maturase [Planctomycetia bacterium]